MKILFEQEDAEKTERCNSSSSVLSAPSCSKELLLSKKGTFYFFRPSLGLLRGLGVCCKPSRVPKGGVPKGVNLIC